MVVRGLVAAGGGSASHFQWLDCGYGADWLNPYFGRVGLGLVRVGDASVGVCYFVDGGWIRLRRTVCIGLKA